MSDQAQMLEGGFGDPARASAMAFRAAMNAMARPGLVETLRGANPPAPLSIAAGTLLLTLCDPDTPLYLAGATDCDAVRNWVRFHTGAPLVGPAASVFALGTWDALTPIDQYPFGAAEYPDRSTTLIVETAELHAAGATLYGPGIADTAQLNLPETAAFQANAARFPLGCDFFFTCGERLAALPRSTKVA